MGSMKSRLSLAALVVVVVLVLLAATSPLWRYEIVVRRVDTTDYLYRVDRLSGSVQRLSGGAWVTVQPAVETDPLEDLRPLVQGK